MNFSHGDHEYHGGTIANCREAAEVYKKEKKFDACLAIALDTKGPEIRTGKLDGVSVPESSLRERVSFPRNTLFFVKLCQTLMFFK